MRKGSLAAFSLIMLCLAASPVAAQPEVLGQWSSVPDLPFFPVHIHLLPDGKVMFWGGATISGDNAHLWDPDTAVTTPLSLAGFDIFCSGHSLLGDGRLLVAGGNLVQGFGVRYASIYDPGSNVWTRLPDMNAGRWYPTVTTLANGDALVIAGTTETGANNNLPQVWQAASGTWRNLTNAVLNLPLYPWMHAAPNGKIFMAGPGAAARYLETAGTGAWTAVATSSFPLRDYGSSVLYDEGKVLIVGGGGSRGGSAPPTNTAQVIDLNAPAPAWRAVAPMAIGRRHLNATLLPDGTVLVNGGTSGAGFDNPVGAVFAAELWNPAAETWTTLASAVIPRLYHSAALLLPDGRVLTTGGNYYPQTEVFEPPYLFKGPRPTITAAPPTVTYGEAFLVETPDAASITQVTWLRLSSVTHAFNMNQRINRLAFAPAPGGLSVTAPSSANLAPPGHYMLFLLNGNGVPSVAKIVQIVPPNPVPLLSGLAPNGATAGDPALTLTVTGSNFIASSLVQWDGAPRPTTFINGSQLEAAIPASDLAAVGTAQVTVVNPAPGGGTSNALPFTINSAGSNPVPALTSLSPSSVKRGGPAFTLTVNGSNFIAASVVQWNGAARPTTFINGGQLQAAIPASDIAAVGTAQVTVVNPAPGGGISNTLNFQITR